MGGEGEAPVVDDVRVDVASTLQEENERVPQRLYVPLCAELPACFFCREKGGLRQL